MTTQMPEQQDDDSLNFSYRAEDLNRQDLEHWTVLTEREQSILAKLEGPGQRLLIGPRGSGKSTYLKMAFYQALDLGTVLPIYVNYSRSIILEPGFRRNPNALILFRQWLLAQLCAGVGLSLKEMGLDLSTLTPADAAAVSIAQDLIAAVERQNLAEIPNSSFALTSTLEMLERVADATGRRRVILLLDDAAHAFSAEQQREFFEVFSALRSRKVSAKAAVYPGVTSYTPRFHVGHDAQLVDIWLRPTDPDYLDMMREVAARRVSSDDFERLQRREGVIDYLAFASFGLPRTFIVLIAQFLEASEGKGLTATKNLSDNAIDEAAEAALKVFESLQDKLPRYKYFVQVGRELVDRGIDALREYNDNRHDVTDELQPRATSIYLQIPMAAEADRIIGFLEYAGLVRRSGTVSMGSESFDVVTTHYALIFSRNALALGRKPSVPVAVGVMTNRDSHARVRRKIERLLGKDYLARCRLDLASCQACGAERDNAEARFCSNCGSRLEDASLYDELLSASIDKLPLSAAMLKRVTEHSNIRQMKDVLLDNGQALRKIPRIGPARASRIRGLAEEFVYE